MAWHSNYWSCSTFADWLRGTPKLGCGTSDEWDDWHQTASTAHPIRYWLAEEALGHIQDFVSGPSRGINSVRYYINNRWITKSHALTAHPSNIKPGDWCDVGNRFLPCLFNELVDFVEIEQAWHHCMWSDEAKTKFAVPWTRRQGWRTWRCAEAGLEYLDWASKLTWGEDWGIRPGDPRWGKPTPQAESAQEIIALYTWWKAVYPNRPDPHDVSGWSAYCDLRRKNSGGRSIFSTRNETREEKKLGRKALNMTHKIEKEFEKEDEEMMIRLIKIRQALWT
jgi:hypothetical protein